MAPPAAALAVAAALMGFGQRSWDESLNFHFYPSALRMNLKKGIFKWVNMVASGAPSSGNEFLYRKKKLWCAEILLLFFPTRAAHYVSYPVVENQQITLK